MLITEVKNNLIKIFPNHELQITEYIDGIADYDCEKAYDNITISELEDDFKIFLSFYREDLDI
jgi:hypothetical protein